MKIIAWNLNHRTRKKKVPSAVITFLSEYRPDLVVLCEFVDSPKQEQFYSDARAIGYEHSAISKSSPNQNQVLIFSRLPLIVGDIVAPKTTEAAETNFLHVILPEQGIEVVGLRAPAYTKQVEKANYWKEVATIAAQHAERSIIFLGDLNYDPFKGKSPAMKHLSFAFGNKYSLPNPQGEWSYVSACGTRTSRIDHAIISSTLRVSDVRYLNQWREIQLAGPRNTSSVTDHAVLSLLVTRSIDA